MKNIVLFFLAIAIASSSYSQNRIVFKKYTESLSAIKTDRTGREPLKTKPITTSIPVAPSNILNPDEVDLVTIVSIGTSANAYGYGSSGGQKSILYANNDINTITHLHRMGGTLDPAGYSGDLGYDISTNGGMTWTNMHECYTSTISGGTENTDAARYPNHGIYNPIGNTNPNNAYITFFAPTLDGSNAPDSWGGYGFGRAKIGSPTDTTKHLLPSSTSYYQYIPDGYDVSKNGVIVAVDVNQDWTSGAPDYQGSLIVSRGVWDGGQTDFVFTRSLINFPTNPENDRPVQVRFAFGPDGQTGWLAIITDNQSVTPLGTERYYYPVFIKTTNGGYSWEEPISVRLDGPDGLPGVLNYLTDQQIMELFAEPVPERDEIPYTTAFDCDVVVDKWGNPHMAVVIGVGGTAEYSMITDSATFAAFDISSTDGGTSWVATMCGKAMQFRGTFGTDFTEDNRIQASSTQDGEKVFITWLDTQLEGAVENNAPDIFARGIDVNMSPSYRVLTVDPGGQDMPTNVTASSEAAWEAYFMVTSRITLDDGDGTYTIPFTYETFTTPFDPALSVQFMYIQDFSFTDEDFGINTNSPEIDVDPLSFTIYEPVGSRADNYNKNEDKDRLSPVPSGTIDPKYIADTVYDENNRMIIRVQVPGRPPENHRAPVAPVTRNTVLLPGTPAYDWSFGCSSTSAAMMAGYYDNNNYPEMYTGPTNSGIAPMTNEVWGSVTINGEEQKLCPISATRYQLDGRNTYGHVDDYWVLNGSNAPDPYIGNWTEHTYGDCTGDYMKTNQYNYDNIDGSCSFYYDPNGFPYSGNENNDGCYGLKQFFESRGYVVEDYYTQLIYGYDGNTVGFSFADYMDEIDAGNPVLIQVEGHTMLGFGYDDTDNTVYLHDTWDYAAHQMTWGSDYEGLGHWGVSVIHLADPPIAGEYLTINNLGTEVLTVSSITVSQPWILLSGYPATPFNIAPGDAEAVSVEIDWTQIGYSTVTGNILISSNDPDEAVVTVPVTAIPIGISDLIVQNQTVDPVIVDPGGSVLASCVIHNQGTADAGASNLRYYLSANSIFGISDIELGADIVEALGSGQSSSQSSTLVIPSNTITGVWYILYFADSDSQVAESDENNNIAYFQINVQVTYPDLLVTDQEVNPTSVTPGGSIDASCNVFNQGTGNAGSSLLKYYLSSNNTFGAGDQLLDADAVGNLGAGQSSSQNQVLLIPANTSLGTWFILFFADADFQVIEADENNNLAYIQITVESDPADLVITYNNVDPTLVIPGSSVNVLCDINNQGTGTAGSSNLKYYLSANNSYEIGDELLGTDAVGSLDAGQYSNQGESLIIPSNTINGTWYVLFFTDADNQVAESNENNNVNYSQINVQTIWPDLVVINLDVSPGTVNPGGSINASCNVFNLGEDSAGSSSLKYYLSANNSYEIDDQLLGTDDVGSIEAGLSSSQDQILVIPSGTETGTWYVLFFTDADSLVAESNETNNIGAIQIAVNESSGSLVLEPASYDFGNINVGNCTGEIDFVLSNSGSETVTGSIYMMGAGSSNFDITEGEGSYSLPSYFSKTIKVRFCPLNTGNISANLLVSASPGENISSELSGFANEVDFLSISTDSVEFAPVLGSTTDVVISSNVTWQITGYPTWLDLSMISGTGNATVTITANSNNSYPTERIANLIISGNNVNSQNLTIVQLPFTGIHESDNMTLKVYPNPASSHINIDVSGLITKPGSVDVINSFGVLIFKHVCSDPASDIIRINTEGLAPGAYCLRVNFDNITLNKLILITGEK